MFRFENTEVLYALIIIPVILLVFIINRNLRNSSLKKFGDPRLLSILNPETSPYKSYIKITLILLAVASVILGIANPQIGTKISEAKREGVDVIIALDISNSMRAEDIKPNRLERAKQMINKLIDKLENDRIGLVAFAGEAFVQLPLTTDYSAAKLFLGFTEPELIPSQGTAIGRAIELASEQFKENDNRRKALIIISDGENHEDDAVSEASRAAEKNFVVYTIGMGTTTGAPVPIYNNGSLTGYLKDRDGNVVITKYDPTMLQQIAAAGKGQFFPTGDSEPELNTILSKVAGLDKKEFETKLFTDYEDRYQYFFGLAFFFLFLELLFSERKNKFITSLKLFETKRT